MAIKVNAAERALEQLTVPQLKQRYAKVYGEETRTHHKVLLMKRILWRMQALREGDLSERACQRAREVANDADPRAKPATCAIAGRAQPPGQRRERGERADPRARGRTADFEKYSWKPRQDYDHSPSGTLALHVNANLWNGMRRRWSDSAKRPLEKGLNSFLAGIVRVAVLRSVDHGERLTAFQTLPVRTPIMTPRGTDRMTASGRSRRSSRCGHNEQGTVDAL